MARHNDTPQTSARLRRARPLYVALLTTLAVWFWWLVAISQTSLAGRTAADPEDSIPAPAAKMAEDENLASQVSDAAEQCSIARENVDLVRRNVARAEQRWEDWLAARAAREKSGDAQAPLAAALQLTANPEIVALNATVQKLQAARNELLQRLTPEHPEVKDIDARLAAVRDHINGVPELVLAPAAGPAAADNTAARDAASGSTAANDSGTASAHADDAELPAPESPRGTEAEVRQAWDESQEMLQRRLTAEQQANEHYESLQRRLAAAPATIPGAASPELKPLPLSSAAVSPWPMIVALGSLVLVELAALRMAFTLLAAEKTTPLVSVAQVAALLPVPVFAAIPASGEPRPIITSTAGQMSALTVWVLACEGTLAVFAFVLTALTIRNLGFPAEFTRHPIETMALGLRQFHP